MIFNKNLKNVLLVIFATLILSGCSTAKKSGSANGDVYTGSFFEGWCHGEGTHLYESEGSRYRRTGTWEYGKYQSGNTVQVADEDCAVCLEPYAVTEAAILPCLHSFCAGCIKQLNEKTCPLCRASFQPELVDFTTENFDVEQHLEIFD